MRIANSSNRKKYYHRRCCKTDTLDLRFEEDWRVFTIAMQFPFYKIHLSMLLDMCLNIQPSSGRTFFQLQISSIGNNDATWRTLDTKAWNMS